MAAWRARPAADKGWPGDQARPRGLKPRAAAAATARRVPSCWQRSSRAAGDRLLSGAGDQAGGCSGLQGGEPRGGAGWHLHLGPSQPVHSIYPVHYLVSTPRRDALHRSSSTRCVIRLRLPHLCPALHAAHVPAPTGSTPAGLRARLWAAPILESGGASIPTPNIRVLEREALARIPLPRDMARIPSAAPETLYNTACGA